MIKKAHLHISFFLVFFLITTGVFAQEILQKAFYFDKALNYNSFPANSRGSRVIALLSSNNITNLYWVYIGVHADLQVQINTAEYGQLSANILLESYSLEGETHFRDFTIDTLLMPDLIEGNIRILYNDKLLVSQPWLIGVRTGYVSMFIPDSVRVDKNNLKVELEVKRFDYSNQRYSQFIETTNLINAYYAFTQVLNDMLTGFEKRGLNKNEPPSYLFLSWEEIQRVNNYVYNYRFYNRLNLEHYDPAGFLALYNRSIRLQRRASTLKNWIKSETAPGLIDDKQKFCSGFADLSMKYLDMAADHQPYIASGFTEVARIITSEQVKDMLRDASKLYDVFNKADKKSTSQLIYDHFVALADSALVSQKYVSTLDLLYNANLMPEWFETVKRSPAYEDIYVQAIDGLMSAYLRVATMAYRSGSYFMAEMYYQKAVDVYMLHSDNLGGKKLASEAFLLFISEQTALSYKLINDKEYFKAVELLSKAKEISEEQELHQSKTLIDSAFRLSYSGIYDEKLDSIQQLIDAHRQDEALQAMEKTNAFSLEKNEYLKNMNKYHFMVLAQALFNTYYNQGVSQMQGKDADRALFSFLKAKRINDKYLDRQNEELDSMIYYATVPVILNIIQQGEFEVWANRTDKANDLLAEALDYQKKYELMENAEVNAAIGGLSEKIKNRHCTNLNNDLFALGKQAENRINSGKYSDAEELLQKGRQIIKDYPYCELEGDKITSLWYRYEDAFNYYHIVKKINQNLEKRDYTRAIDQFVSLGQHYQLDHIKRYGIEAPDLKHFIVGQNNRQMTDAAAAYFVAHKKYEEAFVYLKLLHQQDVASRETRNLQQMIGEGLAEHNNEDHFDNKNLQAALDGNDKWYRYMQWAYHNKPSIFLNIFNNNK